MKRPPPSSQAVFTRPLPIADVADNAIGAARRDADAVRFQGYRVGISDVDILSYFYRVVDLDAELAHVLSIF
ncbi:MAG: hypothetical protein K2X32_06010, partial [Phycisphaerales bacterium]|nr:hypothetical protein [Phycisphaerales bacterium]